MRWIVLGQNMNFKSNTRIVLSRQIYMLFKWYKNLLYYSFLLSGNICNFLCYTLFNQ